MGHGDPTRYMPRISGHPESGGSGRIESGGDTNFTSQAGPGRELFKYHGSGLVGAGQEVSESSRVGWGRRAEVLQMPRVGSDCVGSGRVGSGRVGSGRVGSGRVGSGRVGSTRQVFDAYLSGAA